MNTVVKKFCSKQFRWFLEESFPSAQSVVWPSACRTVRIDLTKGSFCVHVHHRDMAKGGYLPCQDSIPDILIMQVVFIVFLFQHPHEVWGISCKRMTRNAGSFSFFRRYSYPCLGCPPGYRGPAKGSTPCIRVKAQWRVWLFSVQEM